MANTFNVLDYAQRMRADERPTGLCMSCMTGLCLYMPMCCDHACVIDLRMSCMTGLCPECLGKKAVHA